MTRSAGPDRRLLADRLFDAAPVGPIAVGLGLSALLVATFLILVSADGSLQVFVADGFDLLAERNARLGLLLALMAGLLPALARLGRDAARQCFREVEALLDADPPARARLEAWCTRADPAGRRWAGAAGLLMFPLALLLVDRDPGLYLLPDYWGGANLWTWPVAAFVSWQTGAFIHATLQSSLRFSRLADRLAPLDLLDLQRLEPFGRLSARYGLLWVVVPSLFAVNAVDAAFAAPLLGVVLIASAVAGAGMLLPVLGVHRRLRDAKRAELDRIGAALRGDASALHDSALGPHASADLGLADLLAYRAFVEALPDWPFDARLRARTVLYLALPLGSWLGGAMVERMLDLALD